MYRVELTTEEVTILIGILGSLHFKTDSIDQGQKIAVIERKLKSIANVKPSEIDSNATEATQA